MMEVLIPWNLANITNKHFFLNAGNIMYHCHHIYLVKKRYLTIEGQSTN